MHPDILQVSLSEKKKAISISQIREIGLLLTAKPNEAHKRMVLIEDADKMNVQDQNALLKMLEEPPENTFFILTATHTPPPFTHHSFKVPTISILSPFLP